MDNNEQQRIIMDKNGQQWIKMDNYGRKIMAENQNRCQTPVIKYSLIFILKIIRI